MGSTLKACGHAKANEYRVMACFEPNMDDAAFAAERLVDRGWKTTNTEDGILAYTDHDKKWEAVFEFRDVQHELNWAKDVLLVDPTLGDSMRTEMEVW